MADNKKITQLDPVSSLTGSESFEVVQLGENRRISWTLIKTLMNTYLSDIFMTKSEYVPVADVWDSAIPYVYDESNQQYVSYTNPSSEDPQYQVEGFYRLLSNTSSGESPETHPAKWAYQGMQIGEVSIDDVVGLTEALAGKIPATEKGTANGVATLDNNSKIPTIQIPSIAKYHDISFALSDETSDLS